MTLTPVDDHLLEGDETITAAGRDAGADGDRGRTLTLADDEEVSRQVIAGGGPGP